MLVRQAAVVLKLEIENCEISLVSKNFAVITACCFKSSLFHGR